MLSLIEFIIWSDGDFKISIFDIDYNDYYRSRALFYIEKISNSWNIDFLFFHIK